MLDDDTDEERLEATMREAARAILAGFEQERISPGIALGILGMVVTRMLVHAPHYRAEFIACLQDHEPRPSLCRGRRVYSGDLRYECDWLQCPVLDGDDDCPYRLPDDDPNPNDEPRPDA